MSEEEEFTINTVYDAIGYAKYMSMVLELEKKYPNDTELGREVRKLIHDNGRDNDGVTNSED